MTTSADDAHTNNSTPTFLIKNIAKRIGDCKTDENCLEVLIACPLLKGVKPDIREKINASIILEVIESMEIERDTTTTNSSAIEAASEEWANLYKEYLSEEIGQKTVFSFRLKGSGLIHKNYAVTELPIYTNTGGAHPNSYTYLSNYNLTTGDLIEMEDIIKDGDRFNKIVEKSFYKAVKKKKRSSKKSSYFWDKPFYLPANFAIRADGLFFIYNPYEVAAYSFGSTEFTVPYNDLKGIIELP